MEDGHLMNQPSARARLEAVVNNLESLRADHGELEEELQRRQARIQELEERVESLLDERATLEERLERAGEGVRLADENERLRESVNNLSQRLGRLEGERDALQARNQRDLFLAGVGVLVAGVIFGLILPYLRFGRRRRWGWGDDF